MQNLLTKKGFICDMDGVIYHGNRLLPGVQEFVAWLQKEHKEFLFLTNNSGKTQRELQSKLSRMGLDIDEKHFLHQRPGHRQVHCRPDAQGQSLRHRGAGPAQRPV